MCLARCCRTLIVKPYTELSAASPNLSSEMHRSFWSARTHTKQTKLNVLCVVCLWLGLMLRLVCAHPRPRIVRAIVAAIFDAASTFPLMMRPSNSGLTGPSGLAAAMPATAAGAAGAADDGERHVGSEVMVEHEGETFHAVVTQYFPPDDNDSEVPRNSYRSVQSTMIVSKMHTRAVAASAMCSGRMW